MWLKRDQLQIFISENNVYLQKDQAEDQQVATFEKKFNSLDQDPLPDLNSLSSPNDSTSQLLEDLKKKKPQVFNQGYYETINDKKLAIITTLPIPEQYKRNKEAFRFRVLISQFPDRSRRAHLHPPPHCLLHLHSLLRTPLIPPFLHFPRP